MMVTNALFNLAKEAAGEIVKVLETQPFVIVVKNEDDADMPDVQVTVRAADPCDAVVLAARVVAIFKNQFKCDPIVEFMPFLEDEPNDK